MPIYEYEAVEKEKGCTRCRTPFEYHQRVMDPPLTQCPHCNTPVRKLISWCRAMVVEASPEYQKVQERVREYESQGMWSNAAEMADTYAEKTKDKSLKLRAVDNYIKAGHSPEIIESHLKTDSFLKEAS